MTLIWKDKVMPKEPPDPVGLFLMRHAPRLLGFNRMNTAATTILLLAPQGGLDVRQAARQSIRTGACRIDVKLISDLYEACPSRLKPLFASADAVSLLPPRDFNRIFSDAYARTRSPTERHHLALALDYFLYNTPGEIARYRAFILKLLRSREQDPSLIAINMAKYIDDLGQDDLEVLRRKLSSRYFPHRGSTLYTFQKLLERHRSIDPRVLEFCTSEKLVEQVRRMRREDPDSDVRIHYTKQFLAAYEKLPQVRQAHRRGQKAANPPNRRLTSGRRSPGKSAAKIGPR